MSLREVAKLMGLSYFIPVWVAAAITSMVLEGDIALLSKGITGIALLMLGTQLAVTLIIRDAEKRLPLYSLCVVVIGANTLARMISEPTGANISATICLCCIVPMQQLTGQLDLTPYLRWFQRGLR